MVYSYPKVHALFIYDFVDDLKDCRQGDLLLKI
nr:MAG TPA: hypothetical protein [Bacteriophage sp.]